MLVSVHEVASPEPRQPKLTSCISNAPKCCPFNRLIAPVTGSAVAQRGPMGPQDLY